jgi:hypothetical protein
LHLKCVYCHSTAESAERASFPSALTCQTCHPKLDSPKEAKIKPEKPVYVLPDFVFFSHARHASAAIACDHCHGDVWRENPTRAVLAMKMKACVDCHKTSHATVACNKCHELNQ